MKSASVSNRKSECTSAVLQDFLQYRQLPRAEANLTEEPLEMVYIILHVCRAFSADYGIFPSLKHLLDQLQDDACSDNCTEMRSEDCFKSVLTKNIKKCEQVFSQIH